jgi:hypothetical protein
MKRLFTFLLMAFAINALMLAQLPTIVLDDFENGQVNFTETVNVNPSAHFDIAVVDNPVKAGINTSNKVWEWKRYDAESENKVWAGFYSTLKTEIPTGYHRIEIKYLRTNSTSQMKIKPEGAVSKEIASVNPATKTNEWETLVFDIYTAGIKNVRVFGFFPDFYEPIDPNAVVYIDDIKFIYDPTITPPPAPTSISFFTNSASDLFHDQSWVNVTAPSTVSGVLWSDPTQPGDKMPAVTSPVKDGANALKLQWKSVETGDWNTLVASIGWTLHDVSQMTHLKFWVNSPTTLAKANMPKLRFEAGSGNPNNTGKVMLENYLTADLAANTWTEITVPLADIWAAEPLFISKDLIKGLFFSQNNTDNVEHTLFIDEIKFVKVSPGEVFFDDSASDLFHDQSWVNPTAPSTVNAVLWSDPTQPGDKLPVVTSPVKDGKNALKLQWKSVPDGSWAALVAAVGWKHFDLTKQTHFQFWVNSPATLTNELLPKIYLEAHSGNPNKTGKLNLGNYVISLSANTWTEVRIPLADFWAADPTFTAKDDLKGIFFEQNVANNVEHTMYMDEFKFISVDPSPADASIFIDFGSNNPAYMTAGNWNNVTDPLANSNNLIDEGGNATGIKLAVTDGFNSGYNTGGTTAPTGEAAIFEKNATSDNFYNNAAVWGTTPINPEGIITLTGLNPVKYYTFNIFASRTSTTNIRDAKYTFTGSNGAKSEILDAANNVSNIAMVKDVKPTAQGEIVFKVEPGPNNSSVEKFFYLGAMKVAMSSWPTAVENINDNAQMKVYYNNNTLRTDNYTGLVQVYNIAGKLLSEGQSIFGFYNVSLAKGLYVVKTSIGNSKLVVQ